MCFASISLALIGAAGAFAQRPAPAPGWSAKAAAAYLDSRTTWWMAWPRAQRDHQTFCVSCHTLAPYALGRPALRSALGENGPSSNERKMLDNIARRVRLWNEVEPFYSDQTSGLPKTSESRGTEAILNALILTSYDTRAGKTLSPDSRLALDAMWALQLRTGDKNGSWAWLQFHNSPWEGDSQFYGAALAAIAAGEAPGGYQSEPGVQPGIERMKAWLQSNMAGQTLADRAVLLWASAKLSGLLTAEQQMSLAAEIVSRQRDDGGFSMSNLVGSWKRSDHTPLEEGSDGYATGLVAFALEQLNRPELRGSLDRAVSWLSGNQIPADGRWPATSLNKRRELSSDAGLFMSDAATAYAVMALERVNSAGRRQ